MERRERKTERDISSMTFARFIESMSVYHEFIHAFSVCVCVQIKIAYTFLMLSILSQFSTGISEEKKVLILVMSSPSVQKETMPFLPFLVCLFSFRNFMMQLLGLILYLVGCRY